MIGIFKIEGHSMKPWLRHGSIVISMKYFFRKPKIGDVIVFKSNEKYIIKRIKGIDGKYIRAAGDNIEDSTDFRIIDKDIVGKVIMRF